MLLCLPAAQGASFSVNDVLALLGAGKSNGVSPITPIPRRLSANLLMGVVLFDVQWMIAFEFIPRRETLAAYTLEVDVEGLPLEGAAAQRRRTRDGMMLGPVVGEMNQE